MLDKVEIPVTNSKGGLYRWLPRRSWRRQVQFRTAAFLASRCVGASNLAAANRFRRYQAEAVDHCAVDPDLDPGTLAREARDPASMPLALQV